jgi:hypothetical protein
MSNRRFIELSNANRNRIQYPQPAQFEVPFAPSRSLNTNQTVKGVYGANNTVYTQTLDVADTVTNGIVEYQWTAGPLESTSTLTVLTGSTASAVYLSGLTSVYKNVPNYYVGYQLNNGANSAIIASYNPSSSLFTFVVPLATTPGVGTACTITDPSSFGSAPYTLVLPAVDLTGKNILQYDQAYNNYYVINETLSASGSVVSTQISSYNFLTNTATLEGPLVGVWLSTHSYTLRKTLPTQFLTTIVKPAIVPSLPYTIPSSDITLTSSCIFLPSTANQTDNYYTGQYIYVYPQKLTGLQSNENTPLSNIEGNCFHINSYVGNGYNACFVSPVNPPNVDRPTQYYPSYASSAIPNIPTSGTLINIVSFENDNYTPLIYNGSVVSQNETVAYEISLVNLTLPNITLVTGARIAYYPYVYVELSNVTSSSSSSKNVIYSNNPHSNRALFLVPITDINDPQRSPFIKLDAGSMVQTVKFKPNDCLRFSVFLSDGTLYETIMSDYYCPSAPNPFVQIDALFGIRRLSGV